MTTGLQTIINYMIPAVGTPRGYVQTGVLSATPVTIDFSGVSGGYWDGQPFRPSGVFIDNTQGTGQLALMVREIAYQMTCPAGGMLHLQFPAPLDVTVDITGLGQATLIFVDIPVMPYRSF
jgi:hypothetical protein